MLQDLVDRVLQGDRRALARLVSLIENGMPESRIALAQLHTKGGQAHIIGVTGSPGAGKSTLVSQLAHELRQRGSSVGIIAIDPSSPFSGGAILGDRIRMQDLAGDPDIFIRSMASRGTVGGLSASTRDVVRALDAAGFQHIIIETVGAGQAEIEIVRAAQTIVVVTVPGMGDDIQALKAGILETADIFCVNKADRPGADQAAAELHMLLSLDPNRNDAQWRPPILKTTAATGDGVGELADALYKHLAYLKESNTLKERGERQARSEIQALLYQTMMAKMQRVIGDTRFAELVTEVAERQTNPYTVATDLARELGLI